MKSRYYRTTQSLVILTSNESNVGRRKSLTVTKVRCHLFLDESNVNDVGPLAQLKIEIQPQVLGGINLFRGKRSGKKGTSPAPPTEYSNTSKHSFLRKDLYHTLALVLLPKPKMTTDAVSSTPTASTPAVRRRWDVFLSFRGEDTRGTFTDCLYTRLQHKGVRAFRDNEGLNRGDKIDRCLLDAIEDSAAFIAIISPNYANSRWCLEELAKVCECNRLILPVFYNVDPSHVRGQRGPFLQHFKDLEARFGEEDVSKWRKAMKYVGGLAGFVVNG